MARIAPSENAGQQAFALLTGKFEAKSIDAATAIGEVGSDEAITLLTQALEGEGSPALLSFQSSVITALTAHGIRSTVAVPMLIKFLSESEPDTDATFDHRMDFYDRRLSIIQALSEMGAPASPALVELRRLAAEKEDRWLSDTAGEAIWKIEKSQTDPRSRSK